MDNCRSILTKAHSDWSEPGILCAIKNNLSVLDMILAVKRETSGTLGEAGASTGGGGDLLAASA